MISFLLARAGHSSVVKGLVASVTFVSAKLYDEEERERLDLYFVKDRDGDTPLHLALKSHQMKIASCLVKANKGASFLANKVGISPLYLAVEAGKVSLVKEMLKSTCNDGTKGRNTTLDSRLEGRRYLAHAALKSMRADILNVILDEFPSLVDERDEEGRTCLSFGASIGCVAGVRVLIARSAKSIYVCDDDGSFPIHSAVEKGNFRVVDMIRRCCPDSKHLLNRKGQNILHIVASSGSWIFLKLLILCYVIRIKDLATEQDMDGNTPLHLATLKWRPRIAFSIKMKTNLYIQNNSGLTALDIAELRLQSNYIYRERMTLMILLWDHADRDPNLMNTTKLTRPSEPLNREGKKDYINALLVVATLVATVTFAAGFTIPGGFNSSAPNLGMATLATDPRLFIFLLLDTLAMQSSILAIVSLVWAQLGDPALFRSSMNFALPLLCFALASMAFAFFFGVVMTVQHVRGLVLTIYIITGLFFCMMCSIIVPHVFLQRPGLGFFWGLLFMLCILLVDDNEEDNHQISTHKSMKRAESVEISGNDQVEMPDTT
ncbi:hypothetical protein EUTSA_v10028559mg [Eutrema salsugineum]|uniref:PGG domain-containing protein n=1 Tax=Eutrema salsugineum TaxID=72664 RepID=V4KJM5_EUTSA|nr:hypothetical protein EUTSA_v10028559mg [Eutrema salsugineum]